MTGLIGEYAPLDLSGLSEHAMGDVHRRLIDGSWRDWSEAAARVGHCARPIRLHGSCVRVDRSTGAVVDTFGSEQAPLGVLHVRCGNRRAEACPSCSRVYARDTFAMVTAGVTGGKTVPQTVAANPLLFVTLTAPSLGSVHAAHEDGRRCHPRSRETACQHGQFASCMAVHRAGEELVGAPLCPECYDTASAVVWQWWAPELWRRFTIALRRALARTLGVAESRLGAVASVQYAKVAEYQRRGLVHFHALIRLDGPAVEGIGAPAPLDATALARAVRLAVPAVEVLVPGVDDEDVARRLCWGRQVDVRIVRPGQRTDDPTGPLTAGQVAGYLAKYATKDAGDLTRTETRRPHIEVMQRMCRQLADRAYDADGIASPYALLGKWVHMLGFRGHFSTKSRRYSITLGALRRARGRWQALAAQSRRTGEPIDLADLEARLLADDEQETTLVVGHWVYVGTGWQTAGDEALALAAAARAREHAQALAEERKRTKASCGATARASGSQGWQASSGTSS